MTDAFYQPACFKPNEYSQFFISWSRNNEAVCSSRISWFLCKSNGGENSGEILFLFVNVWESFVNLLPEDDDSTSAFRVLKQSTQYHLAI